MKAVVELGGKQYLVEPGTIFLAEKVDTDKGDSYTCDKVLLIVDDSDIVLGNPFIDGGKVIFSVLDHTKRTKTVRQKFTSKKGILHVRGHRQPASQLQVEMIEGGGKTAKRVVSAKKTASKKSASKTKKETVTEENSEGKE